MLVIGPDCSVTNCVRDLQLEVQHLLHDLATVKATPSPSNVVMVAAITSAKTMSIVACGKSSKEIARIALDHADPIAHRAEKEAAVEIAPSASPLAVCS